MELGPFEVCVHVVGKKRTMKRETNFNEFGGVNWEKLQLITFLCKFKLKSVSHDPFLTRAQYVTVTLCLFITDCHIIMS